MLQVHPVHGLSPQQLEHGRLEHGVILPHPRHVPLGVLQLRGRQQTHVAHTVLVLGTGLLLLLEVEQQVVQRDACNQSAGVGYSLYLHNIY